MIAEMVNMVKETVRQILHDQLNMRKVSAKMVPKNLNQEQKDNCKNICSDITERITEQPDVLEKVITCNETWIFQYDPAIKTQSMHWKTLTSLRMKKARMSKSKVKAMIIVFFNIRGIIMVEWVPVGQTVPHQALTTSTEEKAGIVEEEIMDSASSQCASSQRPRGEAVFS
jgi:predicted nucleotidyltransferase